MTWKCCDFCGNWETKETCSVCGEQVFRTKVFSEKLPIYISLNWSSSNILSVESAYCAQAPWMVEELIVGLNRIVKNIWRIEKAHQIDRFPWLQLREDISQVVEKLWKKTNMQNETALFEVFLGVKVFLQKYKPPSIGWLFVRDFSKAVSKNGSLLKKSDLSIKYGMFVISEKKYRIDIFITAEQSVLLDRVELLKDNGINQTYHKETFLEKGKRTEVLSRTLDAKYLYNLSRQQQYYFDFYFKGREKPFKISTPKTNLKWLEQGDLYLDIGSTTTKFYVVSNQEIKQAQFKETTAFFSDMSVDIYNKRHLLTNPEEWKFWIRQLLPKVRYWLLNNEVSPLYLRNLCVTLPVEDEKKIQLFKKMERELQSEQVDLLGSFQVHFEHVALEKAYIPILMELIEQGKEYQKGYEEEV